MAALTVRVFHRLYYTMDDEKNVLKVAVSQLWSQQVPMICIVGVHAVAWGAKH